jgi:hypothetical protein
MARSSVARLEPRGAATRWAEARVDWIADHKAGMLVFSLLAAVGLSAAALFIAFGEGEGEWLTSLAEEVGGYVAIGGLVLGLPALGYAMVTDRAVEQLPDRIGTPKADIDSLEDQIDDIIKSSGETVPPGHHVQIFVPDRHRDALVPLYDPEKAGPREGWEISAETPQAITGSAWVLEKPLYGVGEELTQSKLRLTSEQLRRYGHLTGVAAVPMKVGQRQVGVLTIYAEGEQPEMATKGFQELHSRLAIMLSPTIGKYVPETGPLKPGTDVREPTV